MATLPHTLLLGFSDSEYQARELAKLTGIAHKQVIQRRFPDGETYLRLPEQLAEHIIFLCTMHPANHKLVELMLASTTARNNGVKRISLLAPYLCYMRQDAIFHAGEAVSQTIVGDFLSRYFDDLLTVDPHLHRTHQLADAMPIKNVYTLTASQLISDFLKQTLDNAPILLGPDAESEQWVKQIAEADGLEYIIADKTRFGDCDVKVKLPDINVKDRNIVIIDDISSSGNTLIQAAKQISGEGARHIFAAVTHALLDKRAMQQLKDAGIEKLWSTDTVTHETNAIRIGPILHQAVQQYLLDFK